MAYRITEKTLSDNADSVRSSIEYDFKEYCVTATIDTNYCYGRYGHIVIVRSKEGVIIYSGSTGSGTKREANIELGNEYNRAFRYLTLHFKRLNETA